LTMEPMFAGSEELMTTASSPGRQFSFRMSVFLFHFD